MKAFDIIERMKQLEVEGSDNPTVIVDKQKKLLEQECNTISICFPHLDDNLRPVMELVPGETCPRGLNGQCDSCDHFVCYVGDNEIFAYKTFTGYCAKDDDECQDTQPLKKE